MDEHQNSIDGKSLIANTINQMPLVEEQCNSNQELDLYPKIKIQVNYGN